MRTTFGWFREQLLALHDPSNGIVIDGACIGTRNTLLLKTRPELGAPANCTALYDRYGRWGEYKELMNATFVLVPGGRQPASYRLVESMLAGAIPVMITSAERPPEMPLAATVCWSACAVAWSVHTLAGERDVAAAPDGAWVLEMRDALLGMPAREVERRQRACRAIVGRFFDPPLRQLEGVVHEVAAHLRGYGDPCIRAWTGDM